MEATHEITDARASKPRFEVRGEWKETYTADELIDAWQEGIEEGFRKRDKEIKAQGEEINSEEIGAALTTFWDRFNLTLRESERLFLQVWRDAEIRPSKVFVRIATPYPVFEAEALLVVPEDDYLDDDRILEAYRIAGETANEICDDNYQVSFGFIPDTPDFDVKALEADGFDFRYEREDSTSVASQAG